MGDLEARDPPLNARSLPLLSAAVPLALVSILVSALAAHLFSQAAQPPALTLLSREGRRPLPIAMVGDQEFVALDDLAAAFQLAVREESGAITVSYKNKTIILTPDQTLASVSGRLISLPAPPSRSGRRWLVPLEFISRALTLVYDVRLDLRKPSHLLIVGDLRVPRVVVRYDAIGTSARLTVDATPRATSTITQDGERLAVKFDADALDVANPPLGPQGPQSLVQDVRIGDATTLVVDLGPRFGGFRAASQPVDNTMRQVIDIAAAQTETPPAQPPPLPSPPEVPPAFGPPVTPIRTIAIDPGHGGEDEGVHSAGGLKEKDLVLTVARRLKGIIEARLGIRVLLTRDDDHNVKLDDRTAMANNNKADLFISLHADASMRQTTAGASIVCAAFDETAQTEGEAHTTERVPTFGGGLRDIELVPWDLAQTRHIDGSLAFATILQDQLRDHVPLAPHPLDRAPLRVLESANMPAVLIEMGFLSNEDQEKLIASDAFQTTFVQAMYDSIIRFRDALAAGGIP
jgi:N-acetylmuramoyl-L-alanine amidase